MQRQIFLKLITVITMAFSSSLVLAQSSDPVSSKDLMVQIHNLDHHTAFLRPNERTPEYLPEVLREMSPGAYLTVGTERGFITTALTPGITRTFFVDRSAEVVLYNRLNIELLKIARDYEDYVWLRTQASDKAIVSRVREATNEFGSDAIYWFAIVLRSHDGLGDSFTQTRYLYSKVTDSPVPPLDTKINYLQNRTQTERLMRLAKVGRLSAHQLDLSDLGGIQKFHDQYLKGKKVALVDVSNAWWSFYADTPNIRNFLSVVTASSPKALALFTSRLEQDRYDWFYMTFSAEVTEIPYAWTTIENSLKDIYVRYVNGSTQLPASMNDARSRLHISSNAFKTCESIFNAQSTSRAAR